MPDFRVNPIQMPDAVRATPLDFRPLGEIGDVVAAKRRKDQIAAALGSATDPSGNIDVEKAGTALAQIGEDPRPFLALAQQKAQLAQQGSQFAQAQGLHEKQFGLEQQKFQAGQEQAAPLPYGAGLYHPKTGAVIREPSAEGVLSDTAVKQAAEQLNAGDTSVLYNIGRGNQGSVNVTRVREEAARQNREGGVTGEQQAGKVAGFQGQKSEQRTFGTRAANIKLPAQEFVEMAPLALQASDNVNRTQYPTFNSIIQAWQRGTGGEEVVRFAVAANTLANIYARAVSPTGVPTDELRKKGQALLDQAYSKGQFGAAVDMMQQEIGAALRAPATLRAPGGAQQEPPAARPLVQQAVRPAQVRNPSPDAQQFLLANPDTRDDFDAHYGAGASDRILGWRK